MRERWFLCHALKKESLEKQKKGGIMQDCTVFLSFEIEYEKFKVFVAYFLILYCEFFMKMEEN